MKKKINNIPSNLHAAVLFNSKKPLKIIKLAIPKLKCSQVLVKVLYSGICRSQIMEIDGLRGKDQWLPHMLGHEASGIVVDIGKKVKKIKKNDEVILTWIKCNGQEAKTTPNFNFNKTKR